MKTKKIAERAKKRKPGKKDEKALSEKKRPGKVLGAAAEKDSDITERKQAAEALRESEEQYRDLVEKGNIAIVVDDIDGNLIYFNNQFLKLFGYSAGEIKGKTHKEFVHPDSFEMISKYHKNRMQGKKTPSRYEFKGIRKDGSIINVEIDVCEILKKAGKISGTRSYMWDITERKRAAEALRGSEQKYRTMIEQSNDMIWTLDTEGNFTFFNRRSEEISGQRFKDWRGKSFAPLIVEEDLPLVADVFRRGLNGESQHYEVRVKKEDGNIFTLSVNTAPILEAGKVVGTVSFGRDITERKQAEEKIKMLSFVVEQSTEGMAIAGLDGILSFVNEAWCRMHGYKSSKELLGKNLAIFHDQEQMENEVKPFNEKVIKLGAYSGEVGHITRDGKPFPTLMTSTLLKDKQGMPYALAGIAKDITERKQAEEMLRESEEKYRTLVDNIQDGVFIIQGVEMQFVNQAFARIFGYTVEEVIGMDFRQLVAPEDLQMVADRYRRRQAGKDVPREYEFHELHKDGKTRILVHMNVGLVHYRGRVASIGTVKDITERKRVEEQIQASLREKEVLLQEIHHRVKNNLMIIIGLIKMQETKADNEMFNPLMQELEGRIRAMALVHEGFYKSADLAHVNLQNYIEMMSIQIHAQFGADRDIRFSVQAAGVDVDLNIAVPCGLILNELIANAFKHAFPDGRPGSGAGNCEINVIVNQAGGMIGLAVADNGVGLPADLDWEKSDTLGLRLIKMLSKQINGSIELDRSAGTVFRLKFPIAV